MSMRRVSKKRGALMALRRAAVQQVVAAPGGTVCARCMSAPAQDPHEPKMRSAGGSITDPDNIVGLCRACHSWVHLHPAAAYALGWLIQRGQVVARTDLAELDRALYGLTPDPPPPPPPPPPARPG